MIKKSHTIIYVNDQEASTNFYSTLLNQKPTLHVPGMTEFILTDNSVLGLMPANGIKKLLKDKIEHPKKIDNHPRAELYLIVEDIDEYINRADKMNVNLLDGLKLRDWGHRVIYYEDIDGYIIAFAETRDEIK